MVEARTPVQVYGPCANCGAIFQTPRTVRNPRCPNCGHQACCED